MWKVQYTSGVLATFAYYMETTLGVEDELEPYPAGALALSAVAVSCDSFFFLSPLTMNIFSITARFTLQEHLSSSGGIRMKTRNQSPRTENLWWYFHERRLRSKISRVLCGSSISTWTRGVEQHFLRRLPIHNTTRTTSYLPKGATPTGHCGL